MTIKSCIRELRRPNSSSAIDLHKEHASSEARKGIGQRGCVSTDRTQINKGSLRKTQACATEQHEDQPQPHDHRHLGHLGALPPGARCLVSCLDGKGVRPLLFARMCRLPTVAWLAPVLLDITPCVRAARPQAAGSNGIGASHFTGKLC